MSDETRKAVEGALAAHMWMTSSSTKTTKTTNEWSEAVSFDRGWLLWLAREEFANMKCKATFAEFKLHDEVAELLICDEPHGHVGPHHDTVARKAWRDGPGCCDSCDKARDMGFRPTSETRRREIFNEMRVIDDALEDGA